MHNVCAWTYSVDGCVLIFLKMADGDVPLVTSFGGSEIEFGANGTKVTRTNSRLVSIYLHKLVSSYFFFFFVFPSAGF